MTYKRVQTIDKRANKDRTNVVEMRGLRDSKMRGREKVRKERDKKRRKEKMKSLTLEQSIL